MGYPCRDACQQRLKTQHQNKFSNLKLQYRANFHRNPVLKKYPEKYRRWQVKKSKEGNRSARAKRIRNNEKPERHFREIRKRLPQTNFSTRTIPGYKTFDPPNHFSFFDNYNETLAFILDFRELFYARQSASGRRRPYYANFSKIHSLDAASGLVLAAEIDQWRRTKNVTPIPHDHLWQKGVRDFFHDTGLFELLGIDPHSIRSSETSAMKIETLKFQSGTQPDGKAADTFRENMEGLTGKSIGPNTIVYDAISEAMTNVNHHAYPSDVAIWPIFPKGRWWLGGSWNIGTSSATVQMYDQGVGIPQTLPKSEHWVEMFPILRNLGSANTHVDMIEAAMQYGRTSTGQQGRGMGLAQMANWIERAKNGSLRIISGKGDLNYLSEKNIDRTNHIAPFCGTLIEWSFEL